MNVKPLIIDKLGEYFNELPEYSMGDILYSIVSDVARGRTEIKKSDLLKIDDGMFHRALSRSLIREKE